MVQASPLSGKCLPHSLTHLPIFDVHIDIHSHQPQHKDNKRERKKLKASVLVRHGEKIPAAATSGLPRWPIVAGPVSPLLYIGCPAWIRVTAGKKVLSGAAGIRGIPNAPLWANYVGVCVCVCALWSFNLHLHGRVIRVDVWVVKLLTLLRRQTNFTEMVNAVDFFPLTHF